MKEARKEMRSKRKEREGRNWKAKPKAGKAKQLHEVE